MSEIVGRTLGEKYEIVRLIGEGGMGGVYEARHVVLNRRVAVKVMHAEFSADEVAVERFILEAQAASAIGHPNIIEIYDIGREVDGTLYMVMELLEGQSLEALIESAGQVPLDRVIFVILQMLSALHAAHEKGVIHRDLKPANVFLSIDKKGAEEVKLLDFGVAKVHKSQADNVSLTVPGAILGTPGYMSPEQARGIKEIDARVDIWATGVLLFVMLTGDLPFPGETFNEVLSRVLMEPHPRLEEKLPGIPDGLCAVVDKALAKNPEERQSSASEMIQDLTPFQGEVLSKMSTNAVKALRSTVPAAWPAAYSLHDEERPISEIPFARVTEPVTTVNVEPEEDAIRAATEELPQKDDEDEEDFASASMIPEEPSSFKLLLGQLTERGAELVRRSPKRVMYGAGGLAATIVTVVVLVIAFSDGQESSAELGHPPVDTTAPVEKEPALPPTPQQGEPDTNTVRALPEVADKPDPSEPAAAEPIPEPNKVAERVSVRLAGVPRKAKMSLNGKRLKSKRFKLTAGEPAVLRVRAPGYKVLEKTLELDRDQTIELEMEKTRAKPRKGKKKKRGVQKKTKKRKKRQQRKKKNKVLLNNPFGR